MAPRSDKAGRPRLRAGLAPVGASEGGARGVGPSMLSSMSSGGGASSSSSASGGAPAATASRLASD